MMANKINSSQRMDTSRPTAKWQCVRQEFAPSFFTDAGIPSSASNKYARVFNKNRMQIHMLPELTKDVLHDLGITLVGDILNILGHSKKVIAQLSKDRRHEFKATPRNNVTSFASKDKGCSSQIPKKETIVVLDSDEEFEIVDNAVVKSQVTTPHRSSWLDGANKLHSATTPRRKRTLSEADSSAHGNPQCNTAKRSLIKGTDRRGEPYPCVWPSCGKTFKSEGAFHQHTQTHTAKTPQYSCTKCEVCFLKKQSLNRHLQTRSHKKLHPDEKPYACSTCGKTFKMNSHLENHKRTKKTCKNPTTEEIEDAYGSHSLRSGV